MKVPHYIYGSLPQIPTLSQMNAAHTLPHDFSKILTNLIQYHLNTKQKHKTLHNKVRYQVLMATSMKMTVFWDALSQEPLKCM